MIALLLAALTTQGPAPDPAAVNASEERPKPRLAVTPLKGEGVEPGMAEAVSSAMVTRLHERGEYEVVTQGDVASLMKQEEMWQLTGCSSDQCLSDLARITEAQEIVSGTVSSVGERFIVALVRLDTVSGAVRRRVQRETRTAEELVDAAVVAVDALWDEKLPATDCIACVAKEGRALIALKIGNNFTTFFSSGLDVSALAPGFDLELAYHLSRRFSLTFSAGLNFGRGTAEAGAGKLVFEDKLRFQVVPLTLGARFDTWRPTQAVLIYTGLGIGVGLVRTALEGVHDLSGAFSAELNTGMLYAFARRWRFIAEVGYGFTTDTPNAVRSQPLNALKVALGAGFVF